MPEEVRDYHQRLRLQLVSQFGLTVNLNVPAHITVKYPFVIENDDEIEELIQKFCETSTGTGWHLQGFNHFINEENRVVFIDVVPQAETRSVHAKFLAELRKVHWVQWGQFDTADLHYHVTLATHGLTTENFDAVWAFLKQQEKPDFQVHFDNLALVLIEDHSRSVYKIFQFQS